MLWGNLWEDTIVASITFLAGLGLCLLVLAILVNDIGFDGRHEHIEYKDDNHSEHGTLEEMLEVVFTVVGG